MKVTFFNLDRENLLFFSVDVVKSLEHSNTMHKKRRLGKLQNKKEYLPQLREQTYFSYITQWNESTTSDNIDYFTRHYIEGKNTDI